MNRLQYETSPYLLQHANNPVDWYPWGEEAFTKALNEDKPILVSIGYSTCHWCHVMEHESFEDEEVATYMNEHFVNIKVDREERPDVDQIYMDACQSIHGSGGWPLNSFLLPDKRPFYAGTYYPPQPMHNRASWMQLLQNMRQVYYEKRKVVEDQANQLMDMMHRSDRLFLSADDLQKQSATDFNEAEIHLMVENLQQSMDQESGGWGGAPKFPGSMSHGLLLQYYFLTGKEWALDHVVFSLEKMISGGIYDHLGGGFARYATDRNWLIPHFEKMLYDNALLVNLLADVYKVTQKPIFKKTIVETLAFIDRELTDEIGGCYAALDADTSGQEGKYYLWQKEEIDHLLQEDAALFNEAYGVTLAGNWEGSNILHLPQPLVHTANKFGLSVDELEEKLSSCKAQLFRSREQREKPGLDDKMLLSWNALQCSAYVKAFQALNDPYYKERAIALISFLTTSFVRNHDGGLYHSYKAGQATIKAYLNDYAFLIEALLGVYEISGEVTYLESAMTYCQFTIKNFLDQDGNLFYFTSEEHQDIPIKRKDYYDSSIPSGNATMVHNLWTVYGLTGDVAFHRIAIQILLKMKDSIVRYPNSFARWGQVLLKVSFPFYEIVVIGEQHASIAVQLNQRYLPNKLLMASASEVASFPLLAGRLVAGSTKIYCCENFACNLPVDTLQEVLTQIEPSWVARKL